MAKNGSNYMALEAAAALSPAGVQRAVYGSFMTFVLEILTLTATWTVKACLLMLYARLTYVAGPRPRRGLADRARCRARRRNTLTRQHTLVKLAAVYCAVTYLAIVFLSVFYWCSPTREYWAVPVKIGKHGRRGPPRREEALTAAYSAVCHLPPPHDLGDGPAKSRRTCCFS